MWLKKSVFTHEFCSLEAHLFGNLDRVNDNQEDEEMLRVSGMSAESGIFSGIFDSWEDILHRLIWYINQYVTLRSSGNVSKGVNLSSLFVPLFGCQNSVSIVSWEMDS